MTKIIYLLFVATILFSSCKSAFEFSSLEPRGQVSSKLPALEPIVYVPTLENAYSKGNSYSAGSAVNIGFGVAIVNAATVNYADKRVNDAITIFERDVKNNISNYIGEKRGKITFKITNSSYSYNSKTGLFFGTWLGSMALIYAPLYPSMEKSSNVGATVATSLAVPAITALILPAIIKPEAIQTIEVEVEIMNLKGDIIGRYSGIGVGKYKSTMYKIPKDVNRIVNVDAVKNALQEIKLKIDKDYTNLSQLLK